MHLGEDVDRLAQQNIEIPVRNPDGEGDALEGERPLAVAHDLMALGVFGHVITSKAADNVLNILRILSLAELR